MRPGPKPKGNAPTEWSPKLSYAIGLLVADGCLCKDGRHIDFTSKDKAQVQTLKECLGLKVKIGTKQSYAGSRDYYRVQFGDVLFYQFLMSIGLSPSKSKTIAAVSIPDKYFSDFLRGYFDGDGSSYSFFDSVFPQSYRFYISFTSASNKYVHWLRERITELVRVKGHICNYPEKDYSQLKYAKREAVTLCKYMYSGDNMHYLKRKYLKINDSLSIINQQAGVVKLANTLRSGRSARKGLRVQLPPSAPIE